MNHSVMAGAEAHQILESVGTPVGSMNVVVLLHPFFFITLASVFVDELAAAEVS